MPWPFSNKDNKAGKHLLLHGPDRLDQAFDFILVQSSHFGVLGIGSLYFHFETEGHYSDRGFQRYYYKYEAEKELAWKASLIKDTEKLCLKHGVQLVFVYPPNFKVHNTEFVTRMQQLAGPEVLHCVYNYQDSTYLNKDLFYDADHMHISGARVFTNEVIEFLKESML